MSNRQTVSRRARSYANQTMKTLWKKRVSINNDGACLELGYKSGYLAGMRDVRKILKAHMTSVARITAEEQLQSLKELTGLDGNTSRLK